MIKPSNKAISLEKFIKRVSKNSFFFFETDKPPSFIPEFFYMRSKKRRKMAEMSSIWIKFNSENSHQKCQHKVNRILRERDFKGRMAYINFSHLFPIQKLNLLRTPIYIHRHILKKNFAAVWKERSQNLSERKLRKKYVIIKTLLSNMRKFEQTMILTLKHSFVSSWRLIE